MQRLAIWGGSFDPVHWGHLRVAEAALNQVNLEAVLWVPTRCPPHKSQTLIATFEDRLQMLELAIADRPKFQLASLPEDQTCPDYAVDIFAHFQTTYPQTQWYWIIGLDAFSTLPRWYRRQDFVQQCHWLVAPRLLGSAIPAAKLTDTQICQDLAEKLASESLTLHWQRLEMPTIDISSSLIRQSLQRGQSIGNLVPEPVRHYIQAKKLYLDPQQGLK